MSRPAAGYPAAGYPAPGRTAGGSGAPMRLRALPVPGVHPPPTLPPISPPALPARPPARAPVRSAVPAREAGPPPPTTPPQPTGGGPPPPGRARRRGADGATLASIYVVVLLVVPNRLVIAPLPLNITPSLLFGLGLGLWWFCAQLVQGLGAAKGRNAVRTVLFVFVLANIATYGYATSGYLTGEESKAVDRSFLTLVGVAVVGVLICDGVRGLDRIDRLLLLVVNTVTVVAVIGLLQFFLNVDIAKFFGNIPGLRPVADLDFILRRSIFRRPAGTTGHPIEFGVVMALALPIAVHYAVRAMDLASGHISGRQTRARDPGRGRRWRWICVTLIAMGAMVSLSRSAILGLVAAVIVLLPTWEPKRRIRAIGIILGFTVVMRLLVPGLIGTLLSLFKNIQDDPSVQGRTSDYHTVGYLFHQHPWLGRGQGTYLPDKYGPLDNQYLGSLVETGLVGLVTLALTMLVSIWAARAARRASTDPVVRDLAQTLVASVVVLLASYATFDAFAFSMSTGLSFVVMGACGALLRYVRETSVSRRARRRAGVR